MKPGRVIDLSHRMPPGKQPPPLDLQATTFDVTDALPEVTHRPDIWYVLSRIDMSSHAGTHIEFPYHHWQAGSDAADYPLERLIAPLVVLDFSRKAHREEITLDELQPHADRLRPGDIVLIRTDMDKLFWTDRWDEQPYLAPEAMLWLVERRPAVVGTDAAGFEVPGTDYQPNHLTIFKNDICMIESATNLAAVTRDRLTACILPLAIEGIDSCPVRFVAFDPGDLTDDQ